MNQYTKVELEKAIQSITSMITRSEKVQIKLKEGSPQASLTRNRLNALRVSLSLITMELNEEITDFTKEELENSLPPITSTIRKCEKVLEKVKAGSPQSSLTKNMLHALYISTSLITNELNKK